jgi:hypothetical protein
MIEVIVGIVSARIVPDPAVTFSVNVRSLWMPRLVGK